MKDKLMKELKQYARNFGDFVMDLSDDRVRIYYDGDVFIEGSYSSCIKQLTIVNKQHKEMLKQLRLSKNIILSDFTKNYNPN